MKEYYQIKCVYIYLTENEILVFPGYNLNLKIKERIKITKLCPIATRRKIRRLIRERGACFFRLEKINQKKSPSESPFQFRALLSLPMKI